jgi:hypothetical protein
MEMPLRHVSYFQNSLYKILNCKLNSVAIKPLRIGLEQPNVATMSNYNKCECFKNFCSCCADIDIEKLNFNQTGMNFLMNCVKKLKLKKKPGCLNFTYSPADFAVKLDLLMSNHSIFSARVSGKIPTNKH